MLILIQIPHRLTRGLSPIEIQAKLSLFSQTLSLSLSPPHAQTHTLSLSLKFKFILLLSNIWNPCRRSLWMAEHTEAVTLIPPNFILKLLTALSLSLHSLSLSLSRTHTHFTHSITRMKTLGVGMKWSGKMKSNRKVNRLPQKIHLFLVRKDLPYRINLSETIFNSKKHLFVT
jgi:hypothetical protein